MKHSYHTHSNYSDGKASIKEIINYAKNLKLDEIGFSDHFHLPSNNIKILSDMPLYKLNNYVSEVLSFSSSTKPIVKLGLEAEFANKTLDLLKKIISSYPFDYIIGSVHIVNETVIDFSEKNLPVNFCTDLMKQYWILIKQMANSKIFDIVAHLDLTKKFNLKPKIDLTKEINAALLAIKDADMTIEVNTSGWYKPCKEQYPSLEILQKCKKLQIPIIITADAHHPKHLTRGFEKAYKLLKKIGYNKQAYFIKRKRFFTSL